MPRQLLFCGFAIGAYLLGLAGMAILLAYILGTGTGVWPRNEPENGVFPWLSNVGWLLLFACQHSGMARQSFKQWWTRWFPPALERSGYVAFAGIIALALTFCWQPIPGELLWNGPIWIAAISILATLGADLCLVGFDHLTFLGLRQAWTGNAQISCPFRSDGLYSWVRHPLMLTLLITFWAQPIMPPELLLMNLGWTGYILIAIHLEERDLVRQFGSDYLAYQQKVPALIPWFSRPENRFQ